MTPTTPFVLGVVARAIREFASTALRTFLCEKAALVNPAVLPQNIRTQMAGGMAGCLHGANVTRLLDRNSYGIGVLPSDNVVGMLLRITPPSIAPTPAFYHGSLLSLSPPPN